MVERIAGTAHNLALKLLHVLPGFLLLLLKLVGVVLIFYAASWAKKHIGYRFLLPAFARKGAYAENVGRAVIHYTFLGVAVVLSLNLLGVKLTAIVTSLGLLSIAIGFAAQTSISNFISGIILLFDKSIVIGDVVEVEGVLGVVESIDLMSFKIRTFDNILVRIPNRKLIDTQVKNYTFYDKRRMEFVVGISYSSDIEKAKKVIIETLKNEELILKEPEPVVITSELADSSVNLKVYAWALKENMFKAKDRAIQIVKEALDKAGIEIPFPQVVVHMEESSKG